MHPPLRGALALLIHPVPERRLSKGELFALIRLQGKNPRELDRLESARLEVNSELSVLERSQS
jgi:hypothetical protein